MRCKLRVGDIARLRERHPSLDVTPVWFSKTRFFGKARRRIESQIPERQLLADCAAAPFFISDACLSHPLQQRFEFAIRFRLQHKAAGLAKASEPSFVLDAEIMFPVLPIMIAFERKGRGF